MNRRMTSREAELAREGWVRKFVAEEAKARDYARMYEELGFEVRLEPEDLEASEEHCRACLANFSRRYLVIYTRPRPA